MSKPFYFPIEMPVLGNPLISNGLTPSTDVELRITQSLTGLRSIGKAMEAITTLIAFSHSGLIVGALFFEWTWFASWETYRFLIPLALDAIILKFVHSCWMRNLTNIYTLHNLVLVIWLLGLFALSIWAVVDVTWFCGSQLPDFCTNMVDSTIETGYWIYTAFLWFTTILYLIETAFMAMAARHTRGIKQILGMTDGDLQALLAKALRGETTSYVHSIGSKFN